MRDSERNVGRADNNVAGAHAAANGADDASKITVGDSADAKGHGAHGRGRGEEKYDDKPTTQPDEAKGSDRGGSAGWGSEASGGSVSDKRANDK
jgi:hypothetical protein